MKAREQILVAADRLFGEQGFDAATTREIAEVSGVNKALIHYHFKSKDALFEAVLDGYYQRLNLVLSKALASPGAPRQRLTKLVDAYVDFLSQNRNFSKIVQRESSNGPRVDRISGHLEPMFKMGADLIQAAYPKTKGGATEAHHLMVSFYGIIVTYFTYSGVLENLVGKDPLSKKELASRKKHLHWMLGLILDAVENGDPALARARVKKSKT